jgi:uroporphyrinogen-III synthase
MVPTDDINWNWTSDLPELLLQVIITVPPSKVLRLEPAKAERTDETVKIEVMIVIKEVFMVSLLSFTNSLFSIQGERSFSRQMNAHQISSVDKQHSLLPLSRVTVLVTRAAEQSNQFVNLLEQAGATALSMSCLCISLPSSYAKLDEAITNLHQFDWLIFTSTNGIDYFLERLNWLGFNTSLLANIKIAVVGQKTAARLEEYNLKADFSPPEFVSDSLIASFPNRDNLQGTKILYPQLEAGGRENIVEELTSLGAEVQAVPTYQSGCTTEISPLIAQAFKEGKIDVVTFASPKTVECFYQLIKSINDESALEHICIASIGPVTSAACRSILNRVDVEALPYTLDGLTAAIINWKQKKNMS